MSNEIQQFDFKGAALRTLTDEAGEPWFVAKDVCGILGMSNPSMAVTALDKDEVAQIDPKDYLGSENRSNQAVNIVSEPGLYKLIMRSRKPEAKEFQRWVTHEVLPSIRKHGAYMTQQTLDKALTSPDFLIQLATKLKEEQEKVKELEPKARFADAVAASDGTCLIGELAKMLRQNGLDIGQNRLFAQLREDGYLGKTGSNRNVPTQKSMDLGLFRIKETAITHSDGHVTINRTAKVTGKGQTYFVNHYCRKKAQDEKF
jgi:anti-repressor protein